MTKESNPKFENPLLKYGENDGKMHYKSSYFSIFVGYSSLKRKGEGGKGTVFTFNELQLFEDGWLDDSFSLIVFH